MNVLYVRGFPVAFAAHCRLNVISFRIEVWRGFDFVLHNSHFLQYLKRHSRTPIFSVNGAQRRLIEHTPNQFQKKTEF